MKLQVEIAPLGHDWSDPVYTWSDDHRSVTGCLVCRRDETHTLSETVDVMAEITVQPTCMQSGKTTYTSSAFESDAFEIQIKELEDIDPLGHTPRVIPAVPATCTAEGLTEGSVCDVCGETLVPQETVAKTSHKYVVDAAVPAGCETTGLTAGFHCEICGEIFVKQKISPALGHDWGDAVYTWSQDNKHVTGTCTCYRDQSHTVTETVSTRLTATVSPSLDQPGSLGWVSSAFENDAFTVQKKTIGALPALGTLRVLWLPDMLTSIEAEAFSGGTFEAVILLDGCTEIGSRAFANCTNLKYVKVPANTEIAADAFAGCTNVIIDNTVD